MKRSKKIIFLAHCVLNPNAKVLGLALTPGALPFLTSIINEGVSLYQLPCPEQSYAGCLRWGATKEQYDNSAFRRNCRQLLTPVADDIAEYLTHGYELLGIIGMNGSPSCGVEFTCKGFSGGEISVLKSIPQASICSGQGVFIEELVSMLSERGATLPMTGIDESAPQDITWEALKAKLSR